MFDFMNNLIVYLNAERVGVLEQDDTGLLRFTYDAAWTGRPGAEPLSHSLPLQGDAFTGKKARAFFAGILPEEGPRKQIAKILGISDTNDFAMLEKIGGECAGAVSLLPEGMSPPSSQAEHRELTDRELQDIVADLPRHPLMAGAEGLRLLLAGVQDKLPVIAHGTSISLPLGGTPSTHILKPEPDRFPGLAANELFCMTLARTAGLNVPDIEYRMIGEKPCILVQRSDRKADEAGNTVRIHQEDFCQALGFPPERKYQAEGGPMLRDCISLLREWSTAPVLDIPAFVGGLIFNVLIGNADAHAKNFSLLYEGGDRRLCPFYDLVSTVVWPELTTNPAMKIGNCKSINVFSIAEWKKMAQECGLGWPVLREKLAEMSEAVLGHLDAVHSQTASVSEDFAKKLSEVMQDRAAKMLDALSRQPC